MADQYRVVIERTGNVTVEVIGGQGAACGRLSEVLATALGRAAHTEFKPEYFDHEQQQTQAAQH